ncbi:hypothetical protein EVAR_57381_1 [Eumeta japonica]|uniref:Uncharacterized protein n=1 Tax=Eumeta variegata TaxID=151549 RepID=A0A4C1ZEP0_EUMVA|nr:hypothetical protein EVAR_57381_1 [Eumeta japonica]
MKPLLCTEPDWHLAGFFDTPVCAPRSDRQVCLRRQMLRRATLSLNIKTLMVSFLKKHKILYMNTLIKRVAFPALGASRPARQMSSFRQLRPLAELNVRHQPRAHLPALGKTV